MADDRRQSLQGSPARSGCAGRKPGNESHQRGLNTKLHLAVDAFGMPVRIIATEGTRPDCAEAASLIEGIDAEPLIADKGCDSDAIIRQARSQGMQAQIPPRKNRKEPRDHDKPLYRQRHQVENAFCTSRDGAALPRVTLKIWLHSSLPHRFVVSPFGSESRDESI